MYSAKFMIRYQKLWKTGKRFMSKNHYEILKLNRNCTTKEVKTAFINMSKECHPDKNHHVDSHTNYIKIVEAYNILSKPHSRANYDLGLRRTYSEVHYSPRTYTDPAKNSWNDPFSNRDKSEDAFYASKPYYGIRGTKKVTNPTIALLCVLFTLFFAMTQFLIIRISYGISEIELNKKSRENGSFLSAARSRADTNGNDEQLRILMKNINVNESKNNISNID